MSTIEGELAALLQAGALGYHPEEAAINLLIDHGTWLYRDDFTRVCVSLDDTGSAAFIDWRLAVNALEAGDLPCSRSEANILRLAAALNDGPPISLRDVLIGLDGRNIRLVAQAVLHANGTAEATVTAPEPRRSPAGVRVVNTAGDVPPDGQDPEEP